jgi:CIC family chloride channel protein
MGGMAFGAVVSALFGHVVSSPAIFGVVAMGGVFGAAAQAPLTAIASVVEMTGNFGLILPVMLTVGIAVALSKRLTYGSIYTTKLLRRGIDIERPKPTSVLQMLTVSDVMHPLVATDGLRLLPPRRDGADAALSEESLAAIGPIINEQQPQVLFPDETLDQALRQLVLYGRVGLPVVSVDGHQLLGWITQRSVLRALSERLDASAREAALGRLATEFSDEDAASRVHVPRDPLNGYEVVEMAIRPGSLVADLRVDEVSWPPGSIVVAATRSGELVAPDNDLQLRTGERIIMLAPSRPRSGGTAAAKEARS